MNWVKIAITADKFAIPFWIVLIIYGIYEINNGNKIAWVPLLIGVGAFIIDTILAIENKNVKLNKKK